MAANFEMQNADNPRQVVEIPEAVRRSVRWMLEEVEKTSAPDLSHLSDERRELIDKIRSGEINPFENL